MAKITVTAANLPSEEELITAQGVILDAPLSAEVIVYLQRVIRQTLAQGFTEEAPQPAPKKRGKALDYMGQNLAADLADKDKSNKEVNN